MSTLSYSSTFLPTCISGCVLWMDGKKYSNKNYSVALNGTNVRIWHDKSSKNNHASTTNNFAVIGQSNDISFSDYYTMGFIRGQVLNYPDTNGATVFIVARQRRLNADGTVQDTHPLIGGGALWRWGTTSGTGANGYYTSFGNGSTSGVINNVAGTAINFQLGVDTAYNIVHVADPVSNTHTVYSGTTDVTSSAAGAKTFNNNVRTFGFSMGNNNNWRGNIFEVIVYNRALTTTERENVTYYIHSRHSIGSTGTINLTGLPPVIGYIPKNIIAKAGGQCTINFIEYANPSGTPTFTLKRGATTLQTVSGTSPTFSAFTVDTTNPTTYTMDITNGTLSSTYNMQMTIVPPIDISLNATATTSATGVSFCIPTVSTTGNTFRWFKNGSVVSGQTGTTYTVADLSGYFSADGTATINVDVTNSDYNAYQDISSVIGTKVLKVGDSYTMTHPYSAGLYSLQWYKNGVIIPDATTNTYTISSAALTDTGVYSMRITIDGSSFTIGAYIVDVAEITLSGQNERTATLTATSIPRAIYRWSQNGVTSSYLASSNVYTATNNGLNSLTVQKYGVDNNIGDVTLTGFKASTFDDPSQLLGAQYWLDSTDTTTNIVLSGSKVVEWKSRINSANNSLKVLDNTSVVSDISQSYWSNYTVERGCPGCSQIWTPAGDRYDSRIRYFYNNDVSFNNSMLSKRVLSFNNTGLFYTNNGYFNINSNTTYSYTLTYLIYLNNPVSLLERPVVDSDKLYYKSSTDFSKPYSSIGNINSSYISRDRTDNDNLNNYFELNKWMIFSVKYDNIVSSLGLIRKKRNYYINGVNLLSKDNIGQQIEPDLFNGISRRFIFSQPVTTGTSRGHPQISGNNRVIYLVRSDGTTVFYSGVTLYNNMTVTYGGLTGSIAENIIYNQYKSPDDMRKINDYLINKWNLRDTIKRLPVQPPAISAVIFFEDQDLTTNIQNSLEDQYTTNFIEIWNGATQITNIADISHNTNYTVKYNIIGDVSGQITTNIKKIKRSVSSTKYQFTTLSTISTLNHLSSSNTATDLSYNWYCDSNSNMVGITANPTITLNNTIRSTIYPVVSYRDANYGTTYYDLSSVIVLRSDKALPTTYYLVNKNKTLTIGMDSEFSSFEEPIQYQWKRNGTDLSGETTTSFYANNTLLDMSGTYTVDISYNGTWYTSNTATVDVLDDIAISGKTRTQATLTLNVAGGTYTWYKDNAVISGAISQSYTAPGNGKYFARIVKNSITVYSNIVQVDFNSPFLIRQIKQPADISYNIIQNTDLSNNNITYPLKLIQTTQDNRLVFTDNAANANIFITDEDIFENYTPDIKLNLYQVPLPVSRSTATNADGPIVPTNRVFCPERENSIEVDMSGDKLYVLSKATIGTAAPAAGATLYQFIQIYNLPKVTQGAGRKVTSYNAIYRSTSSSSTDDSTSSASHFVISQDSKYLFWKAASSGTVYVYNLTSSLTHPGGNTTEHTTISVSANTRLLTTNHNGALLCTTLSSETANTASFAIYKTDTFAASSWTDTPSLYGITNVGSMLNQLLNRINNDTAVNASTSTSAPKVLTPLYSILTDKTSSLLYLYVSRSGGFNKGMFAVFSLDTAYTPTLKYYFVPESADILSTFSFNSTSPFFINNKNVYRIPDYYLTKVGTTGLEISGNTLSPIPYIRTRASFGNTTVKVQGTVATPAYRTENALLLSADGSKMIIHSDAYQNPSLNTQTGGFAIFDISYNSMVNDLPMTAPTTITQNETGDVYTRTNLDTLVTTTDGFYIPTQTFVFAKPNRTQCIVNKFRTSSLSSRGLTHIANNTIQKVGDWYIEDAAASPKDLLITDATNTWYSFNRSVVRKVLFKPNGINVYDLSNNNQVTLDFFVDNNINLATANNTNSMVIVTNPAFFANATKTQIRAQITNKTQPPDTLNSQRRYKDGVTTDPAIDILNTSSLYDMPNSRIRYIGYPTVLKNSLRSTDSRYVFDTNDLIRWFNPSISKEYDISSVQYEYGWAVRVTRSSISTDTTAGTWGWQVSADDGSIWKTLRSVTGQDTYFFKNKVPGQTYPYKFRYVDASGSPGHPATKIYDSFFVLPWNEEDENITVAGYPRDEKDFSTGSGINYKPNLGGYYIGKFQDGSGVNLGDSGMFSTRAGIIRVDISGSTKPVLANTSPYTLPEMADNETDLSGMSITQMFYSADSRYKRFRIAAEAGATTDLTGIDVSGIDVHTPDISSNQRILGIVIDLSSTSINTGARGKWQYTTDRANGWKNIDASGSDGLVLWSDLSNNNKNCICFKPNVNKRNTDGYETLRFYVYDGSDVACDNTGAVIPATDKNGKTFALSSLTSALSDASGTMRIQINRFNFSPELENPLDYNVEYRYNSSTYSVNGKPYLAPSQNTINIPISDLTAHYIPRDAEINTMGLAIGDISNVPLVAAEGDVSNNYYGPYNLGDTNLLDITNGKYASFTDVSSSPTLYDISNGVTGGRTSLDVWFDMNNYKDVVLDTSKRLSYAPNAIGGSKYLTQTVAANQPTYEIDRQGFKGLKFSGNQWLDICGGIAINGATQTFIVVERRDVSGRMPFIGGDNTGTTDFNNIEFGYSADGSGVILSADGTTTASTRTCNSTNVVNTFTNANLEPIRIWTYQYDHQTGATAKVVRIYLNDQRVATTSITAAAGNAFANITKPTLGRVLKGTNTFYYTGTIYEVAYYNTTVAAATLTSIQQHLMQKYRLLDTTTVIRHGLQAWYDFSNPLPITYDATTKAITNVQNQHRHIPDLSLNSTAGPIYTGTNFFDNTVATFNGAKEFSLSANIVSYFTGANATKSYTLIIVDTRDESAASLAGGFLGSNAGTGFYIGYDTSQNMVIRTGTGDSNILRVSSINITYNATRVWTFTYDAATNRYEIFMNNFKLGSKIMTPPASWTGTTVFGRGYVGTIGEIALYNVVVTYNDGLSTILGNLYKKWIPLATNAAQTETLRCYAWYDISDTALLDLSSSNTTISTIRSRNLLLNAYTLTQTTEANKPRYNTTESAMEFLDASSAIFTMNGVATATDISRSYSIFIVEKRRAVFDTIGTYRPGKIIGNEINFGYGNNTDLSYNSYNIPLAVLPFNPTSEPRRLWTLCYDGVSRKTRIYLNGELIFDKTDATTAPAWSTPRIGGLSTGQYYNGFVYEMMFFNDANPPFLTPLQAKLMEKWAIDAAYSNSQTVCWIDANDARSLNLDSSSPGTQVNGLRCKNTGVEFFSQTISLNKPVVQQNTAENILGKRAIYFSGTTYTDISSAFTSHFVGTSTSYTLIFVERRDTTVTTANTVFGGTGFGVFFDISNSAPQFNCTIGSTKYTTRLIPNYNYVNLPTSVWTISYNATSRTLVIHQNTTRIAFFSGVTAASSWTGASFGNVFNGYIGELMLFSSATVANLTDIQERLVEKWVADNIDVYTKYNPVMAWYDISDASGCLDLSGTTDTVYGLVNRNALNARMNFIQRTATNCPRYRDISGLIFDSASSRFMMMSPYLRDEMLTPTRQYPCPFTIMFVERRRGTGTNNFLGDTAGTLGLNLGYAISDASGVFVNTSTVRHMEHAAPYVAASEGKKLWTFAFVYNPDKINEMRCNIYLNNIFIGYTAANNSLTSWTNPCIGRHNAVYGNFELYEMLYIKDGSISNLTAVQEAILDKHAITYYSVPVLSASKAITTSDVNTGLVASYDSADSSTITTRTVTDISSVANKISTYPSYRLDVSSSTTNPTIGNIVNDISGFVFNGSSQLIRMSTDMSGLFVNSSYTVLFAERRKATGAANYIIGSPTANRFAIGYSGANEFRVSHSNAAVRNVNVVVASFIDISNEPMRIWTVSYNDTAKKVDIYYGNQRVITNTDLSSNINSAELTIGRSVASYYNGTLYEMLIYNQYISDAATLRKLQERLMSKWEVRLQTHYAALYSEPTHYFQNSLVGWFDAADLMTERNTSTTYVSEIPNRIGKYAPYFTLKQATSANRPTLVPGAVNGRNVVRFSRGSSHYMDLSSVNYVGDVSGRFTNVFKGPYTLIIVERPAADVSGTLNPFIGASNTGGAALNNICIGYSGTSNAFVMSNINTTVPSANGTNTKVFSGAYSGAYAQPRIWTIRHTDGGAAFALYLNGNLVEEVTSGGPLGRISALTDIAFGRYAVNTGTNYYSGDLCEMMLFNTNVVPDIDKYHKYLMDKWDISLATYYPNNNGLVAWFDMNDRSIMSTGSSYINRIDNKLTNNPHYFFTNTDGRTRRPRYVTDAVNSLGALQFNPTLAAQQYMGLSTDLAKLLLTGEFTMMVVEKRTTDCSGRPFFGGSSATPANNVVIGYGAVTANTSQTFGLTTGTTHTFATNLNFVDISNGQEQARLWTFEATASKINIYHNGLAVSTGATFTPSSSWLDPYLGRNGANYYNGYICEIMIFKNGALTNRKDYEKYLYKKWITNDDFIDQGTLLYLFPTSASFNFSINRWFDFSDRSTVTLDSQARVTKIIDKLIRNTSTSFTNTTSTGPKYIYNGYSGKNMVDFSGNTLSTTADSGSDGHVNMIIFVERPSISGNITISNTDGNFSYTETTVGGSWDTKSTLASGTITRNYKGVTETPHVWTWIGGRYNNNGFVGSGTSHSTIRYDGNNIFIKQGGGTSGNQVFPTLNIPTNYFGNICEVIYYTIKTGTGTTVNAQALPTPYDIGATNTSLYNYVSSVEKYLLNKWSGKSILTIPIRQNQSQRITMNVAAWDTYRTLQTLPVNRSTNSSYSNQLANLKITVYNQNRAPELLFNDPTSEITEGGNLIRLFDLTTLPTGAPPIGILNTKIKTEDNRDVPGYITLSIDTLFQSTLYSNYIERDTRDSQGIVIVGVNNSRGTWSYYNTRNLSEPPIPLTGINLSNVYFFKKSGDYALRYDVSSTFMSTPHQTSFDILAWDSTNFNEGGPYDLTEDERTGISSYSDPTKIYRYILKSRPYIEDGTDITFEIKYNSALQQISTVQPLAMIDSIIPTQGNSSFKISTSLLQNGNEYYITGFKNNTVVTDENPIAKGQGLRMEYQMANGLWTDLNASDNNPIPATYLLRLKAITITEDVTEFGIDFSIYIKVKDTNVSLYSSEAGLITMKVSETNVNPTLNYKDKSSGTTVNVLEYTFPEIYNTIDENNKDIPLIDLTTDFDWQDNNFSRQLKQQAYGLEVISSANGVWSLIDKQDGKAEPLSGFSEGQRMLIGPNYMIKYLPKSTSNGNAIINLYAWDKGKPEGLDIGDTIYPNENNVYNVGLFSEKPVRITVPVKSPNNAPYFESESKTTFSYTLAAQDDNNTNVKGDTINNVIESIIGTDYRDIPVGNSPVSKGLVVIGSRAVAAYGKWQYTTNGAVWTDLSGTYSDLRALHLASNASTAIRFNFTKTSAYLNTYTAPTLAVRAWDQNNELANGTVAAIESTGGTTSYSAATATLTCPINHINHAPRLSDTGIVINRTMDAKAPHTIDISGIISELGARYIEDDTEQTERGIAIVAVNSILTRNVSGNLGIWKVGTDELNVAFGPYVALRDSAAQIQFTAEQFNTGRTTLTMKLYDGTKAYSERTFDYVLTLEDTNYAPYFNDPVVTTKSYPSTLFGTSIDISVNSLVQEIRGTDYNGDVLGVVIYDTEGVSIYNTQVGQLSYKEVGQSVFTPIVTSKLSTAAYHLTKGATIRYTPVLNMEGSNTGINVLLWDRSNRDSLPSTYTAVPSSSRGGFGAYSTTGVQLTFTTTKQNYAPEISGSTINLEKLTINSTPTSYSVAEMIAYSGVNYNDANITPDPQNSKRGIAIYAQDVYAGAWKYTIDNGASWSTLNLTGGAVHFLETATTKFRYEVATNATDYATLSFYAWDGTNYSGNTYPYVAALPADRGGFTAYSTNAITYRVDVDYVNNRPVFSNTPIAVTIPDVSGYSPTGATTWTRISDLTGIFNNLTDPDANLLKRGGVKEKPTVNYGIIIYDAPETYGTWYYSQDNQSAAVNNVSIIPSEINGFVLPRDYYIRFAPAYNRNIDNISIKCRGIASTAPIRVLSGGMKILEDDITKDYRTVDYTVADATITTRIRHVNKAPVLVSSNTNELIYTLPTVYGDDVDNADNSGVSVKDIMDSAGFTAAYNDPDIDDGIVPATQKGIILTSRSGNAAGSWQYKLSASDTTWTTVGATVTASNGLALSYSENVRVRFTPSSNADASANIVIYAWDQTSGTSGSLINIDANDGDPASISNNSRIIGLSLRYLNHRPYFNKLSVNAIITPGNNEKNNGTILKDILDASGLVFNDRDILDGRGISIVSYDIPSDLSGIWQYRERTGNSPWTDIELTGVFFLKQSSSTQIRFRPYVNPDADKVATLTVKAWDCTEFENYQIVNGESDTLINTLSLSENTSTINFTIEKIYYIPSLAEDEITYSTPIPANTVFTLSLTAIANLFSIPGTDRAIALVDSRNENNGKWFYSIDGVNFNEILISRNSGLVLNEADNVVIRYVNDYSKANTFYNPFVIFHLLDRTIYQINESSTPPATGTSLSGFSSLPKGGTNYLSDDSATFKVSIRQVATPPALRAIESGKGRRKIKF